MRTVLRQNRVLALILLALVAEVIVFVSDFSFLSTHTCTSCRQLAHVKELIGTASLLPAQTLSRQKLKLGTPLYEGDEITTETKSWVKLAFDDGRTLMVEPESVLVLQVSQIEDGGNIHISLLQGSLQEELDKNYKLQSFYSGKEKEKKKITLELPESLTTMSGPSAPYLLKPSLHRPVIRAPAGAGPGVLIPPTPKKSIIRYPDSSQIIQPTHWMSHLFSIHEAYADEARFYEVDLEWDEVPGAHHYVLQISADPRFKKLVHSSEQAEKRLNWKTDIPGTYYWRVAGVTSDKQRGPFSEFVTFNIRANHPESNDETTFNTYGRFDDYSTRRSTFRVLTGPNWTQYSFSPNDRKVSTEKINYTKLSFINLQTEYDYRLSPYTSIAAGIRAERSTLKNGDFEARPQQDPLSQDEIMFSGGVERRYFWPKHYWTLLVGLRVSYLDTPMLKPGKTQIEMTNLVFVGPSAIVGFHKDLSNKTLFSTRLGGVAQYTGSELRLVQLGELELKRTLNDSIALGLRFSETFSYFSYDSDDLNGSARSLGVRPLFFMEVRF